MTFIRDEGSVGALYYQPCPSPLIFLKCYHSRLVSSVNSVLNLFTNYLFCQLLVAPCDIITTFSFCLRSFIPREQQKLLKPVTWDELKTFKKRVIKKRPLKQAR